ncbi:helix-turn-helix domain-containing protein [Kitasatospora atroaurantiaca]|uniref:helix-turn-helix domain-containing protein n=1 Tax=Kitasatospora atroaurantiaca TaxID=285545 RepID=UPI001FECEF17
MKKRQGVSYEWLSRKTNLSRSSVHRYCSGSGLPRDFGTAETIARACGADRAEIDRLYRLWSRAGEPGDRVESTTLSAVEPRAAPAAPERRHIPALPGPRTRTAAWVVAWAMLALLAVLPGEPTPPSGAAAQRPVSIGHPWTQAPTPVPPKFFGVTMNSSSGAMPTFQVGAVRLWDSRTRWANIQPRRGEFDWSILDRLVAGASQHGLPVTFTMGGTPGWASPGGPRAAYDDGSRTSPPDDLADWDAFVTAVAQRYQGRIEAYELWVMGNDARYFSGSMETLAEMTRRASAMVKAQDPAAVVVCPSMGQLWKPEAQSALEQFARLGAYDHCDAAGVKLHQRQASDTPETMLELTERIDQAFHRAGAHPALWSTGTTYDIPLAQPLDPQMATDSAVRFYLVGLVAQIRRMYFYNWGGSKIPIVLQPDGGSPTPAAMAVEELQRWLHGALIRSCGQGSAAGLPEGIWQCAFTGEDGRAFLIQWTSVGTVRTAVRPEVRHVRYLDGSTSEPRTGEVITITTRPVLLELA